jgi:flagellar basal body-associated protein FliL
MNYDEMEFRKISSKKIKRKSVYDELKKWIIIIIIILIIIIITLIIIIISYHSFFQSS